MTTQVTTHKSCSKCKRWKSTSCFQRDRKHSTGFRSQCKSCNAARRKELGPKYRERIKRYNDRYRHENRHAISTYRSLYYQQNRTQILDSKREYKRRYYIRNRDYVAAKNESWRKANQHAVNAKGKIRNSARRARLRRLPAEIVTLKAIALRDGAFCWMCKSELSEYDPTQIDHLIPVCSDNSVLAHFGFVNPGTVHANLGLTCPSCNQKKNNRILLCAIARYLRNAS